MILDRFLRVFIVGELLIAPLPLARVDRLEAGIGCVRIRRAGGEA
jgi:hypothetical protein